MNTRVTVALGFGLWAGALPAQSRSVPPKLEGKWEAKTEDGPRLIVVRADSSAQFGEQVARWRIVGDSVWFTVGDGVWNVYGMKVTGDKLTISGGDLDKPVTLHRVGPPTPKPDTLKVPEPPPPNARAW
ncbi:MAG TPA: hypothetical protein VMH88_02000 [Gemmatimonadales bacterium]|nr:hypothetical protein [Gemmatimonadales bacterium]